MGELDDAAIARLRELCDDADTCARPWSCDGDYLTAADGLTVVAFDGTPPWRDAELLVAAVNALPALLDEITSLRATMRAHCEAHDEDLAGLRDALAQTEADRDAARADAARLRAVVDAARAYVAAHDAMLAADRASYEARDVEQTIARVALRAALAAADAPCPECRAAPHKLACSAASGQPAVAVEGAAVADPFACAECGETYSDAAYALTCCDLATRLAERAEYAAQHCVPGGGDDDGDR